MAHTPTRSLAFVNCEEPLELSPDGVLRRLVSSLVILLLTG
jgi:hypothetical protein